MNKILLVFLLTIFFANNSFGAAKTKKSFLPAMQKIASLLNSEKGINVQTKNQWMRGLSKKDRNYLSSISHQKLLPKGYEAFPLYNGIIVTSNKGPVLGLYIRKTSPLIIENSFNKKFKIGKKNILKSISSNQKVTMENRFKKVFAAAFTALFPEANAETEKNELEAKLLFIYGLRNREGAWQENYKHDYKRQIRKNNEEAPVGQLEASLKDILSPNEETSFSIICRKGKKGGDDSGAIISYETAFGKKTYISYRDGVLGNKLVCARSVKTLKKGSYTWTAPGYYNTHNAEYRDSDRYRNSKTYRDDSRNFLNCFNGGKKEKEKLEKAEETIEVAYERMSELSATRKQISQRDTEKYIKKLGEDLNLDRSLVKAVYTGLGNCRAQFSKKPTATVKELEVIQSNIQSYCRKNQFEKDKSRKANREIAKIDNEIQELRASYHKAQRVLSQVENRLAKDFRFLAKHRTYLKELSYNLQQCCDDNRCKLEAKKNAGINFDDFQEESIQ